LVPAKINRALATLLVRDIEVGIHAAIAAGHPAPPFELKYLDGLSRVEASALTEWAAGIPEIGRALRDRRHPQHAEITAMRDLVTHFSTAHPLRADGSPEPWAEPISEPLLSFAMGWRSSIEPAELSPTEAGAMLAYSTIRGDLAAARLDGKHPHHAAVQAEIEALAARAAEVRAPAPPGGAGQTGEGDRTMTEAEAQARSDVLNRALQGKMSGYARSEVSAELMELHEIFPNLRPFSTASMSSDEIVAMKADRITVVPHEMSERARRLTEELRAGEALGSRRYAMRDELLTELSWSAPSSSALSSSAPAGRRADIRSQRSRDLAASLAGKTGADRRAAVEALIGSLEADQAAADTGGSAPVDGAAR
jgi:hypothetical protein